MDRLKSDKYLELSAVFSSLLYTYLLIQSNVWAWFFALIGSSLFLILCFKKRIYAESVLQVFYIGMAVYGYLNWQSTGGEIGGSLKLYQHIVYIGIGAMLVLLSSYLLKEYTDAKSPILDSFTTVFGIIATFLMVHLIPENWYYWIVIDALSIILYLRRRLFYSAALFVLYTVLAIIGVLEWM